MYVNPFWLGVLVTIFVEVIACVVWAAMSTSKGDDEK